MEFELQEQREIFNGVRQRGDTRSQRERRRRREREMKTILSAQKEKEELKKEKYEKIWKILHKNEMIELAEADRITKGGFLIKI